MSNRFDTAAWCVGTIALSLLAGCAAPASSPMPRRSPGAYHLQSGAGQRAMPTLDQGAYANNPMPGSQACPAGGALAAPAIPTETGTDVTYGKPVTPNLDQAQPPNALPQPINQEANSEPAIAPPTDQGAIPPNTQPTNLGVMPPTQQPIDQGAIPPNAQPTDLGAMPHEPLPTDQGAAPPNQPQPGAMSTVPPAADATPPQTGTGW